MKQTVLAIDLEAKREPPLTIDPVHRRRLVELMAEAIVAVHRAGEEEDIDDDARDQ